MKENRIIKENFPKKEENIMLSWKEKNIFYILIIIYFNYKYTK